MSCGRFLALPDYGNVTGEQIASAFVRWSQDREPRGEEQTASRRRLVLSLSSTSHMQLSFVLLYILLEDTKM